MCLFKSPIQVLNYKSNANMSVNNDCILQIKRCLQSTAPTSYVLFIHIFFPVSETQLRTFNTVIADLRRQQIGKRVVLKVDRSCLLQGAFSHFKMTKSELSPIDVILHTERNEEPCTNLGGPNREFFTLLLEEFKSSTLDMFEGPGSFLLPVNNRKAFNGDMFHLFGKITVLSVLSDGPGFPYFPPFLVSYLRGHEFEHELSSLYIVNTFLKIGRAHV